MPKVSQTGISDRNAAEDYIAAASIAIEDAIGVLGREARRNDSSVEEVVSQAVRRVAKSMFGLRPIAHVHVIRVGHEDVVDDTKGLIA